MMMGILAQRSLNLVAPSISMAVVEQPSLLTISVPSGSTGIYDIELKAGVCLQIPCGCTPEVSLS